MRFEPPGGNQKLILKHLRLKSEWRANQRCNTISAAYLWQLKNHWRKKKEWQLVDIGFWWEGLIKMFYNWIWWKWKWKSLVLSDSLQPHGLYSPWNSPGQNTGVSSHSLLQGIFPPQASNPGLLHCRQFLYQLSHQRSPNIQLEMLLKFTGKFYLMSRFTLSALLLLLLSHFSHVRLCATP